MSSWLQLFLVSLGIGGAAFLIDYLLAPIYGEPALVVGFSVGVVAVLLGWVAFVMRLRRWYLNSRAAQRERPTHDPGIRIVHRDPS